MVYPVKIQYPFNIAVIGKSTVLKGDDLKYATPKAFQLWLHKNYVENDAITLGMSMLHETKQVWEELAPRHGLEKTYSEYMDMLELFAGKTIEVIVVM